VARSGEGGAVLDDGRRGEHPGRVVHVGAGARVRAGAGNIGKKERKRKERRKGKRGKKEEKEKGHRRDSRRRSTSRGGRRHAVQHVGRGKNEKGRRLISVSDGETPGGILGD